MSAAENASDSLKALPHMSEEHLAVLTKHGITTPEKLLEALKDAPRWKTIHSEMKGVGPKTVEKWMSILQPGQAEAATEKPRVVKVPRQAKKPAEEKKEPEASKAEPEKEKAPEKTEAKEEKEPEKAEGVEVVEEGGYVPNKKPKLSPEVKDSLRKRDKISETRPEFTRQEYGRRLRLRATGWRKPRGIHSKTRYKMRYRRPMVSIGYAGPKLTKNYHPSGFREVHVFNVADLSKISDADQEAARIGHGVGQRKRELIIKKADELGIRVLNRS